VHLLVEYLPKTAV